MLLYHGSTIAIEKPQLVEQQRGTLRFRRSNADEAKGRGMVSGFLH